MKFQTKNTLYTIHEDLGDGRATLSGHPEFCPTPTRVRLHNEVVVGNCVWFSPLEGKYTVGGPIRTTTVKEIIK